MPNKGIRPNIDKRPHLTSGDDPIDFINPIKTNATGHLWIARPIKREEPIAIEPST